MMKQYSSRAVDIWKTFIQLRRPFRLEHSSWLSEGQYSFSVCLQKPAQTFSFLIVLALPARSRLLQKRAI